MTNQQDVTTDEIEIIKKRIVALFDKNVRGKKSDTIKANVNHDGKDGHWLETAMGIDHNGDNKPDL